MEKFVMINMMQDSMQLMKAKLKAVKAKLSFSVLWPEEIFLIRTVF